jgi:hypothetical protein
MGFTTRTRRTVVAALIALLLASGCVTQEPPGGEFVEDVGNDFQNEDYFNP